MEAEQIAMQKKEEEHMAADFALMEKLMAEDEEMAAAMYHEEDLTPGTRVTTASTLGLSYVCPCAEDKKIRALYG